MNPFDHITELRREEIHTVLPGQSLNNLFAGIELPQNPGMAPNNWNSAHQDSYCSESVGLAGPVSRKLRLILQFNPYGFTPLMVCNSKNQMIATAFSYGEQKYRLIVFDTECNFISATETSTYVPGTFGGGYFFLDNDDNTVVVGNNKIQIFPTADVEGKDHVYELTPLATSTDIVELVTGSAEGNSLYSCLPVWGEDNLYWCLIAGTFDTSTGTLGSHAYMAVVRLEPGTGGKTVTTLEASLPLPEQWNNNTFSVDESGAYFVTNGLNDEGICNQGYLYAVAYDAEAGKVVPRWRQAYDNSGYLKPGQKNIGSGTTPTLMDDADGNQLVAITDNAYPRMHIFVADRATGSVVARTPVFPRMRGCDEASLIGVNNRIMVENNFGHTVSVPRSQYVSNEPGMAMVQVDPPLGADEAGQLVWEDTRHCVFGMSMLARESGMIFAHLGTWNDDLSATKGPTYSLAAMDSWDGRIVWNIPLGRGFQYCREYGGVYFDRQGGLYIGANRYLVSIQEYDGPEDD